MDNEMKLEDIIFRGIFLDNECAGCYGQCGLVEGSRGYCDIQIRNRQRTTVRNSVLA